MKKPILIFALLIVCVASRPLEKGKYNKIYESLKGLSSQVLSGLGDSYFKKNVLDSALVCYTIVYNRYDPKQPDNEKHLAGHAYNRSGSIYYFMCNYRKAQEMYIKSLNICEESNHKKYTSKIYNNIGNIHASFSNFKRAKVYYEKALRVSLNYRDREHALSVLNNLIGICCNFEDVRQTRYYLNLANLLDKEAKHKYVNLSAQGDIALKTGRPDLAIEYAKRSLHLVDSLSLAPRFRCASLNDLSYFFRESHQTDSALHYLLESEKVARKNDLLEIQRFIYTKIAKIAKMKGDKNLFMHYNSLYKILDDSIMNLKVYGSVKDAEFLFEMEQIDKQMVGMKMEQERKDSQLSQQRFAIVVVSLALLAIGLFFMITYRQKKKLQHSYENIFNKNIEIVKAEKRAKQQHLKYQQELREKDKYIAELEAMTSKNQKEKAIENATKYQSSSLNEEQRQTLAQTINEVMENTLEFCNADFNLERLTVLVNSKTKYVSQAINETYGKNFNRYINEYRIKEARNRLTNLTEYGHITVKGIAQSVGFKSNTNFNILFKEITGITPSIYQSMMLHSKIEEKMK